MAQAIRNPINFIRNSSSNLQRCFSSALPRRDLISLKIRSNETDLRKQNPSHIGLWNTIDPQLEKRIVGPQTFAGRHSTMFKTFNEIAYMVREPALSVIDFLNTANYNGPPNKYVFYGENGVGKTFSLLHVLHYLASTEDWIIVHFPWPSNWLQYPGELIESTVSPDLLNHMPLMVTWLSMFQQMNEQKLKELDLKVTERTEWSKREITEVGSPLSELVALGMNRPNYAAGCIHSIARHLKYHASQQKCKVALVIDGLNCLYIPHANYKKSDRSLAAPDDFTIVHAIKEFFKQDWSNGAVIGAVDTYAARAKERKSHLPYYLLGAQGWEDLDPFIPIGIPHGFNELEAMNLLRYYIERNWVQHPAARTNEGVEELLHISGMNPLALCNSCQSL